MKIQIIIAITFVAIIGMMIPNTFAQQLSISISGNPNPIEYQGNSFTVNFEGELLDYGKVYWSLYEKNSSQKSNMLEALSTDTKSWTKNISFEFFPFVGETYIFEIKNGHIIEQFEFTVQKESYVPLEDLNVEDIFVEETIPIQTEKEIVKFDFMVDYQCSSIDKFET